MKKWQFFIPVLLSIVSPIQAYAFSGTSIGMSEATGLNNASFNAHAGTFTSSSGTSARVSYDKNGAVLSDYQSGQSLLCDGVTFTQGKGGVNIQMGNHVAITDPMSFIKIYGFNRYLPVATSSGGFYIQKHYIHSIDAGGCNFTLDQAIAPQVKYQYVVHQIKKYDTNNRPTTTNGYCLPGTNSEIQNMNLDPYKRNGNWFLANENSKNYNINANCAGLYTVDVYYLINGKNAIHYRTYDWNVTANQLKLKITPQPPTPPITPEPPSPPPTNQNVPGQLYISK